MLIRSNTPEIWPKPNKYVSETATLHNPYEWPLWFGSLPHYDWVLEVKENWVSFTDYNGPVNHTHITSSILISYIIKYYQQL